MLVIGLCGGSGSGKGYVSQRLVSYGVAVIDTDRVYREILLKSAECRSELCKCFGDGILDQSGQVVRGKLAEAVFEGQDSTERLKELNRITHKFIRQETQRLIKEYERDGYKCVFIDAPVLFESKFSEMCDLTVCVTSPLELRIERITERDGITYEKALSRIKSQLTDKELRELCDYEIDNSGTLDIDEQIKSIIKDAKIEAKRID